MPPQYKRRPRSADYTHFAPCLCPASTRLAADVAKYTHPSRPPIAAGSPECVQERYSNSAVGAPTIFDPSKAECPSSFLCTVPAHKRPRDTYLATRQTVLRQTSRPVSCICLNLRFPHLPYRSKSVRIKCCQVPPFAPPPPRFSPALDPNARKYLAIPSAQLTPVGG